MKYWSKYLDKYMKNIRNILITNVEEILIDGNLLEHKANADKIWKNENKLNLIEINPSYHYDLYGLYYKARNIYSIFNSTFFKNSNTIILNGFIFFSSSEFTKLIDSLSGCKNVIFKNCIIFTNKDLMLKEDNGLDLGILIELRGWTYSRWSDFNFNEVIKFEIFNNLK